MDLLDHLKQSLEDDHLSKAEKNDLRLILGNQTLDSETLNFLRSKIYELANAKATSSNFQFVMQWMKDANNVLSARPADSSEVFFSPGETCRHAIIQQMDRALHTLKICVFTISDDLITRAILHAHRRGVAVKIITDNDKSHDHGSDVDQLAREGVPLKMDLSSNHMHHKFMVADDHSVVTGSYNWTSSAARFNHENILVTKEPGVVRSFLKEFDRLWKEMADY
jgi:mitochondrial cardiolipin hydrolase